MKTKADCKPKILIELSHYGWIENCIMQKHLKAQDVNWAQIKTFSALFDRDHELSDKQFEILQSQEHEREQQLGVGKEA